MSRIDYSALPLAKPRRPERAAKGLQRRGRIKPNPERTAALREAQEGEHAALIRACPCAARNPEMYRTDRALLLVLQAAGRMVADAQRACASPPRKSEAHHVVRRSQGGLARHLIPLHPLVHREGHLHGDPHAYLLETYGLDSHALAARLWDASPCAVEEGEDL